jgi:hypothetical protein
MSLALSSVRRTILLGTSILATSLASPALAQLPPLEGGTPDNGTGGPEAVTNLRPVINEDGIDISTGEVTVSAPSLNIGDLRFQESWTGKVSHSTFNGFLLTRGHTVINNAVAIMFIDGKSLKFIKEAGSNGWDETEPNGNVLQKESSGNSYVLTLRDGTRYEFDKAPDNLESIQNMRGDLRV